VVTSFMDGSPLAVPQQQPQFGTSMPVAGAVHSIKSGHSNRTLSPRLTPNNGLIVDTRPR
jgi:hypothetical protein